MHFNDESVYTSLQELSEVESRFKARAMSHGLVRTVCMSLTANRNCWRQKTRRGAASRSSTRTTNQSLTNQPYSVSRLASRRSFLICDCSLNSSYCTLHEVLDNFKYASQVSPPNTGFSMRSDVATNSTAKKRVKFVMCVKYTEYEAVIGENRYSDLADIGL